MATETMVENSRLAPATLLSVHENAVPATLPAGFLDGFDKLNRQQAGHLRHFHNLATQLGWNHMGNQESAQEWLDAYRYQLATMAYAAGAAHYHRLPALRSIFKALFESLIAKMLKREVWGYWFLTSQSGKFVNPDLTELRKPWPDPIKRENIMYSGHLLMMVALYSMLFNDDKYDAESAFVFNWAPVFWGLGPEKFTYSRSTLQGAILAEMERENWLGACCEPNSVFVVCNQFPLIAIRYNDIRNGTNVIDDVLLKYKAAWEKKKMVQDNGLFVNWYRPEQDDMVPASKVGFSAWACAFMNAWDPTQVAALYPNQIFGFISTVEPGRVNVNPASVAHQLRSLSKLAGVDPNDPTTQKKARQLAAEAAPGPQPPFEQPDFGYIIKAVSELDKPETLHGMLNHADQYLNPTWEKGGLFYPRNDEVVDEDGNWRMVDPFTGNGGIGYARLNVQDGQRKMYENPWTAQQLATAPYVDGVDLSCGIDFLRGIWSEESQALAVTMRTWDGNKRSITLTLCNLPVGQYGIYLDGKLVEVKYIATLSDNILQEVEVGDLETDLTVLKV